MPTTCATAAASWIIRRCARSASSVVVSRPLPTPSKRSSTMRHQHVESAHFRSNEAPGGRRLRPPKWTARQIHRWPASGSRWNRYADWLREQCNAARVQRPSGTEGVWASALEHRHTAFRRSTLCTWFSTHGISQYFPSFRCLSGRQSRHSCSKDVMLSLTHLPNQIHHHHPNRKWAVRLSSSENSGHVYGD
ncbi:hypothetical protein GY45DRAFT_1328913 [Cubamyces sp. BRFM 1775]|nr:hypothetical protein GY45DRAFT_1328913 [Cubamyces sp. BRFM 1775]